MPIADIAYGLDIHEIRAVNLTSCEGWLVVPSNKSKGSIAVNRYSSYSRQRFTLAHELGHFLNAGHKPLVSDGEGGEAFQCSKTDIAINATNRPSVLTPYQKQEMQANRFAAEVLIPDYKLRAYMKSAPNLIAVMDMAEALKVSREAAANRYVEKQDHPTAIRNQHEKRID